MTHTQGPWHVENPPNVPDYPLIRSADKTVICEARARDARLIAAAPDLLAAAQALTQIDATPDGGVVVGPRGWEMIRAAIAQATEGEEEETTDVWRKLP